MFRTLLLISVLYQLEITRCFLPILCQWEFQDPKMEVLYHISGHILGEYSRLHKPIKNWPKILMVGTSNKSVPGMAVD